MSLTSIDKDKLSAVMAERGYSTEKLAELTERSAAGMCRITRGGKLRDETLWGLADALDVEVRELLPSMPGQLTTGQSMHLARLEQRMTLQELSERCGLCTSSLSRYENDALPGLEYAWRVARALRLSIDETFFRIQDDE